MCEAILFSSQEPLEKLSRIKRIPISSRKKKTINLPRVERRYFFLLLSLLCISWYQAIKEMNVTGNTAKHTTIWVNNTHGLLHHVLREFLYSIWTTLSCLAGKEGSFKNLLPLPINHYSSSIITFTLLLSSPKIVYCDARY